MIDRKLYRIEHNVGKPRKYQPLELLEKANEYFNWVIDNPLKKTEAYNTKNGIELIETPVMRVMSIGAFSVFAGITYQTFLNYERDESGLYFEVCKKIRDVVENHQFEGASANLLNASIIARKLGLADKKETSHSGEVSVLPIINLEDD